jgi:hypothetical protein
MHIDGEKVIASDAAAAQSSAPPLSKPIVASHHGSGTAYASGCGSLGGAMKAYQLIADATFDPDQLKAIRKAFDDAWAQIAPQISQRPEAIEAGRLKLASVVLSVAKRGTLDPVQLSEEAMKLMVTPQPSWGVLELKIGCGH